MWEVVEQVANVLVRGLGDRAVALYLYGSLAQGFHQPGDSDVNLLLVVDETATLHPLRELFLPIWAEHHSGLRCAPSVASRQAFARHLSLNPILAFHLTHEAIQLHGPTNFMPEAETIDPQEEYARLALAAMHASVALTPEMLQPDSAPERYQELRRLARRVTRQPIPEAEPAPQLLSRIQYQLQQLEEQSPHIQRWVSPKRSTSSLLLPRLEGAYKELGQLVMSFSVLSPHQIATADWGDLGHKLAKHYSGLKLVTSTQLRLIVQLLDPVSHYLQRYEHEWGVDVLEGLELDVSHLLRHAAQVPSEMLVDGLPKAYLTVEDTELGDLIHAFQNKMLNLQLENELLSRAGHAQRVSPPMPLPDRSAATHSRIEAIAEQIDWWADQYHAALLRQGH